MATLYFNNAVNTDLDTLGNWWTDSGFSTPAGALPTVGDHAVIQGTEVLTGTLTCDTAAVHIPIGASFGATAEPVFNCDVTLSDFAVEVHDGTFNGSVIRGGAFMGSIQAGVFNGQVGDATNLMGIPGNGPFIIFNDDLYCGSAANLLLATINHRVTFNGTTWIYSPSSPSVADSSDVRDGILNLDVEGTLDLPAESDVRLGVDYDNANQTGSLVSASKAASLGSGEGFRS